MKKTILLVSLVIGIIISGTSCDSAEKKRKNEEIRRLNEQILNSGTPVVVREEVCGTCRGTGKIKCKTCDGTGRVLDERMAVDGKINFNKDKIVDCYGCDGYGFFVCSKCGGSGIVKEFR